MLNANTAEKDMYIIHSESVTQRNSIQAVNELELNPIEITCTNEFENIEILPESEIFPNS